MVEMASADTKTCTARKMIPDSSWLTDARRRARASYRFPRNSGTVYSDSLRRATATVNPRMIQAGTAEKFQNTPAMPTV